MMEIPTTGMVAVPSARLKVDGSVIVMQLQVFAGTVAMGRSNKRGVPRRSPRLPMFSSVRNVIRGTIPRDVIPPKEIAML
jgi:hypothetical protein